MKRDSEGVERSSDVEQHPGETTCDGMADIPVDEDPTDPAGTQEGE